MFCIYSFVVTKLIIPSLPHILLMLQRKSSKRIIFQRLWLYVILFRSVKATESISEIMQTVFLQFS